MSAFLCSDYHISALAAFITTGREQQSVYHDGRCIPLTDAAQVAQVLYDQNLRSVRERYPDHDADDAPPFIFDRSAFQYLTLYGPVEMIKAAQCYDYQASETDDYDTTFAKAITRAIISKAIYQLPGWDAAEWGLSHPAERLAARRAEIAARRKA